MAIALAMFAGSAEIVIAGGILSKGDFAQMIPLHAPNSPVQTVTIWTSKTTARSTGTIAAARNRVPKVIELHAPNSPTQSVTVWMDSSEKNKI